MALTRLDETKCGAGFANRRVAVLSDALPERNGVGSYYLDLAPQLEAMGLRVEVFHPRAGWGWSLPMPGDDTQRLWLPEMPALERRLRRFGPELLVLPTPGFHGLYGLWFAHRRRLPVLVGHHTDFEALTLHYCRPPWDSLLRLAWRGMYRRVFRRAAGVFAPCARLAAQARSLGAPVAQPLGTVLGPEFMTPPLLKTGPLRAVLFAGRLAAEKNLASFLQAAAALPDLEFHVAGDGPGRAAVLEAQARLAHLHYHGWCRRESLKALMDRCDLLVLPSHVESFGTVALEAMARARPVLVSRHCGLTEWPELTAAVAVMEPAETVTEAISRLRDVDPMRRMALGRAARRAALEMNERALAAWKALIESACAPAAVSAGVLPATAGGGVAP